MEQAVIVFLILAIVVFSKSFLRIRPDERYAIFRLGRYVKIAGPGLAIIVPFIDATRRINLPKHIPHWQSLSEQELRKAAQKLVCEDPNFSES